MSHFNVHGQLTRITAPTLIMVGAKDDVATPAIAKGFRRRSPAHNSSNSIPGIS